MGQVEEAHYMDENARHGDDANHNLHLPCPYSSQSIPCSFPLLCYGHKAYGITLDQSILQQSKEDKGNTDIVPHINGLKLEPLTLMLVLSKMNEAELF